MANILLLVKTFNIYCLTKTFVFLMIYGDVINVKLLRISVVSSANISSLSMRMTSRVGDDFNDNDILTINNFDENFPNQNEIMFDTLQRKLHRDDNNLYSIENCTRATICCTTVTTRQPQLEATITTTDTMITAKSSLSNISSRLLSSSSLTTTTSSAVSSLPLSASSSSTFLMQQQHLLSRPKRYLSFPEGSSFSVAVCFTVGIIGNPRFNYMSFGLNWGVAYDLPNSTWILNHLHGFAKKPIPMAVWHRRTRRALYKEIENVVDNMGYNGRDCVLRALCESRQFFQKTKMGMIGEMLRVVFSLPKQRLFTRELDQDADIQYYDRAYRKARSTDDCAEHYECSFSLLELAFGKYSSAPDGYYGQH